MATIDSLANETLIDIMEMLKATSLPLWWDGGDLPPSGHDDLRAAALVCSRWRDPAQRALFDTLLISYHVGPSRGQRFIESSARSRYRTRSLIVRGGSPPDGWLEVAKACQGLENIVARDLGGEDAPSWGEMALPCFAGLKHLNITCSDIFTDPADPLTSLPFGLSSLALCFYTDDSARVNFVKALFTAAKDSLTVLYAFIHDQEAEHIAYPFLPLVGPRLRTLILESDHDVFKSHLTFYTSLKSIEHLGIHLHSARAGESTNPSHLRAILDALPPTPTLRHLSISVSGPRDFESFIPLIDHSSLSLLKVLSFPHINVSHASDAENEDAADGDGGRGAYLSMKESCEARGIVLETD